jgi:KDO2-lipid IV(A) lauroyltransferase
MPRNLKAPNLTRRLRYRIEYLVFLGVVWLGRSLSRSQILRLGRWAGLLFFYVAGNRRRIALANLEVAFGATRTDREKRTIARQSFALAAAAFCDNLPIHPPLAAAELAKLVETSEADHALVSALLARGRGLLLATAHLGFMALGARFHASHDRGFHLVLRRLDNPLLEAALTRWRNQAGLRVLYKDGGGLSIHHTLQAGETVALAVDQSVLPKQGTTVEFFGLPVTASPSVAYFSLAGDVPTLPVFCFALPGGRCRLQYGPELVPMRTGDPVRDRQHLTQQYFRALEAAILSQPEAYLWLHKRWKYRLVSPRADWPFYTRASAAAETVPVPPRPSEACGTEKSWFHPRPSDPVGPRGS